jgi:hypothetical protein
MKTPRKKVLKVREIFKAEVETYLQSIGAQKTNCFTYEWEVETKAGKLYIHVCTEHGPTIYTSFTDEKAGYAATKDSNPYSGKWNFHFQDSDMLTTAPAYFMARVDALLGERTILLQHRSRQR